MITQATTEENRKTDFTDFLELFSRQNEARPTRLGVFVPENEAVEDYWIEDGMPLAGITAEPGRARNVEIMLGAPGDERHLTHAVAGVRSVKIELDCETRNDTLEITDDRGRVTVLRFENIL
jgi:hypothetical protein